MKKYSGAELEKRMAEHEKNMSNGYDPTVFYLRNSGDSALVQFVHASHRDVGAFLGHSVTQTIPKQDGGTYTKYFKVGCHEENCRLCKVAKNIKAISFASWTFPILLKAIDFMPNLEGMSEPQQEQVIKSYESMKGKILYWIRGKSIKEFLAGLEDEYGALNESVYKLKRQGTSIETTYQAFFREKADASIFDGIEFPDLLSTGQCYSLTEEEMEELVSGKLITEITSGEDKEDYEPPF